MSNLFKGITVIGVFCCLFPADLSSLFLTSLFVASQVSVKISFFCFIIYSVIVGRPFL